MTAPFRSNKLAGRDAHEGEALKVGVIGCGHVARTIYAPILAQLAPQLQVQAICDLHAATADDLRARQLPAARVYTDVAAFLAREPLDAVLVLTSENASASVARQVLAANIPVYLEKPPATSLADLRALMRAEASSADCVYTAFNRRHTPLFQSLPFPAKQLRRMTGCLARRDREVESFPFTSVHLLDSAQYFAQSAFARMEVDFQSNGVSEWRLRGALESGASCDLTFVPDGDRQEEYLTLETADELWQLRFPDPAEADPDVRLIRHKLGAVDNGDGEELVDRGSEPLERSGYAPCLRHFLTLLRGGRLSQSGHRLDSCVRTIEALEAMRHANATP